MNKAKIFKKVSKHLLTQNVQSLGNAYCKYRNESGLSCAIGCLIPDDLYDPKMENNSIAVMLGRFPAFKEHLGVITDSDVRFLEALQGVHDNAYPVEWPSVLAYVEDSYLKP